MSLHFGATRQQYRFLCGRKARAHEPTLAPREKVGFFKISAEHNAWRFWMTRQSNRCERLFPWKCPDGCCWWCCAAQETAFCSCWSCYNGAVVQHDLPSNGNVPLVIAQLWKPELAKVHWYCRKADRLSIAIIGNIVVGHWVVSRVASGTKVFACVIGKHVIPKKFYFTFISNKNVISDCRGGSKELQICRFWFLLHTAAQSPHR